MEPENHAFSIARNFTFARGNAREFRGRNGRRFFALSAS